MSDLDRVRASVSATIADMEQIPIEVRRLGAQAEDWEAYEIVRRLTRKIEQKRASEAAE